MQPLALDHVALYVRDVARSAAWYRDVLGLERRFEEAWGDFPTVMVSRAGSGVALFPARSEAKVPQDARAPRVFAHVAFRVTAADLQAAKARFAALGLAFEEQDHIVARSIYTRDLDEHQVELTTYEVA